MTADIRPAIPCGIILIDKPARRGLSSMTVCRVVKRKLVAAGYPKSVKVGHGGTLDPLASGLMVVLIGRAATRLCDEIMAGEKEYEATVDLSRQSPTDDLEGETVEHERPADGPPTEQRVREALSRFIGEVQQRPPVYSAIWVDGKRAYKTARKSEAGIGAMPEMVARPVVIHEIELLEYAWPLMRIRVRCGKGTYIRSLARDIGTALTGNAAVMSALRRTRVGRHDVKNACGLESLPDLLRHEDLMPVPPL